MRMNVSQPTLHRILESAHKKVAESLVQGKAFGIGGGNYEMREGERLFKCYECENEWQEPYGTGRPCECPKCNSTNIHRAPRDRGYARTCRGRGKEDVGDMDRIKLAIPCIGQASLQAEVSPHFGHCDSYAIVTIEDGKVKAMEPSQMESILTAPNPLELYWRARST